MNADVQDYLGIERWAPCSLVPRVHVSTMGRLRSATGRIIALHPKADGYLKARLYCPDKKRKTPSQLVHRLVAAAFIPNPYDLPQVHHCNHDITDNRVVNLEWTTQSTNIRERYMEEREICIHDLNYYSVDGLPLHGSP